MKVLITGATGFIGYNLLKRLSNYKLDVIAIGTSNELDVQQYCTKFYDYKNFNYKSLNEAFDIVFHQAANNDTQLKNKSIMLYDNYYYPCMLFDFLYKKGCRKFIYASSCAVYGNAPVPYKEESNLNPLTYYGISKKLFDAFASSFYEDANVVGLRYSNVYGSNEKHKNKRASMIYQIIQKIKNNEDVILFEDGNQKRDWIYVDDVVDLNIKSVDLQGNYILNCGSGESTSFNKLVEIIKSYYPSWTGKLSYIKNNIKDTYQNLTCCDITKSKEFFNFNPTSIEEGIKKTITSLNL